MIVSPRGATPKKNRSPRPLLESYLHTHIFKYRERYRNSPPIMSTPYAYLPTTYFYTYLKQFSYNYVVIEATMPKSKKSRKDVMHMDLDPSRPMLEQLEERALENDEDLELLMKKIYKNPKRLSLLTGVNPRKKSSK